MANTYPVKTFEDRYNTAHILVEKYLNDGFLSATERDILLRIVIINYHETHKIAGAYSCDSSCHNCAFCQKMRKAAESDPTIICGYCYDHAQEIRMPSVKEAHGLTLFILSNVLFTVDDWKRRPISKKLRTEWENILRINSAGETENVTQGINYLNLLYANPVFFGGYWGKMFLQLYRQSARSGNRRIQDSSRVLSISINPTRKSLKLILSSRYTMTKKRFGKLWKMAVANATVRCVRNVDGSAISPKNWAVGLKEATHANFSG